MCLSFTFVGARTNVAVTATGISTAATAGAVLEVVTPRQRHQTWLYLLNVKIFFVPIVIFDVKETTSG